MGPRLDTWYDEEELLQLNVFVAELELIVGSARDKRPDNVALLELLQKLVASINTTDRAVLKANQKRCEAVLVDVVYKGACAPVRQAWGPDQHSKQRLHARQACVAGEKEGGGQAACSCIPRGTCHWGHAQLHMPHLACQPSQALCSCLIAVQAGSLLVSRACPPSTAPCCCGAGSLQAVE